MPELRAIHLLIHGRIVRREDMDTDTGRTLGRLRNLQVLANVDKPAGVKADRPSSATTCASR